MRQAFAFPPSAGQSVTHRLKDLRKELEYGEKGQEGVSYPVSPKGRDDMKKLARLKIQREVQRKLMQRSWGTAGVSVWVEMRCHPGKRGSRSYKASGERH